MRKAIAATCGFLIAPLVSALILVVFTLVADGSARSGGLLILPIYYSAAAGVTVLLGLPIFLVLLRFNLVRWWSALLAGTVIGALAGITIGRQAVELAGFLVMVSASTASGLTFWMIWRLGREPSTSIDA